MVEPNIVYLPHLKEGDFEHRLVSQISQEALWIASSKYFPELGGRYEKRYEAVLFYEIWTPLTSPQYFEDISQFKVKKIEAIKCYSTQLNLMNLAEAILGLNRYRGEMHRGVSFAEAFSVKSVDKI
jgi:LmbE family N-acetylglucosaminyl deacetylase